jgi:hypothetical protein
MKKLLFILIIFFFNCVRSQDTIHFQKSNECVVIYQNSKIIEKIFFNSGKLNMRILYFYDKSGIIVRRVWYDANGQLIGITFD